MYIKLGIIGHKLRIDHIIKILDNSFKNIKYTCYYLDDLSHKNIILENIKEMEDENDCLLFTGSVLYQIISKEIIPQKSWYHLQRDNSNLTKNILKATLGKGISINKISLDTYSFKDLKKLYNEVEINEEINKNLIAKYNILSKDFQLDLIKFHTENYQNGNADICLTGLSDVYTHLKKNNIPCINMHPTYDSIFNSLTQLNLNQIATQSITSKLVVLAIEIDEISEYSVLYNNEYNIFLEKTEISKQIYSFAQKIQGVVMETGVKNYFIFCTDSLLERETNKLRNFTLLNNISNNISSTIRVGVGYGLTVRRSKQNSILALNKSKSKDGNVAYVFYDHDVFVGPLYPIVNKNQEYIDDHFYKISQKSLVGIKKISQLANMINEKGKNRFTSSELSEYLNISTRSTNRIISKLEQAGYANVCGKKIVSSAGRPSRIIEISLSE